MGRPCFDAVGSEGDVPGSDMPSSERMALEVDKHDITLDGSDTTLNDTTDRFH